MFTITKKEIEWAGRPLTLETGKVARQADGAVIATYGETIVLATVAANKDAGDADFFPLTVNYQEKAFAAGKIPGGFFKREGRPTERETLICRLIDRPIRPLFPSNFRNETQVICTLLSHDMENDPDVVAMVAASAALSISGVPFLGPIGAVRVGYINNEFVLNPSLSSAEESQLDLVVAGTSEGVLMVESEAEELSEEVMLNAVNFGHESYQPIIKLINDFAKKAGKEIWDVPENEEAKDLLKKLSKETSKSFAKAYTITDKTKRKEAIEDVKNKAVEKLSINVDETPHLSSLFKEVEKDVVRSSILETNKRIDGRDLETVRPIETEVSMIPRAHGSALFTRGETQAIVATTLGTDQDEQIIDALEGEYREGFMLHYNFPPYSVGEAGRVGSPGRREIGHGKLAWRAIHPLLPKKDTFPYTIRTVSEITESNGSSSMATVCGTSLSMMDAGIPLKKPVAGIAMGLIKEGDKFAVLSDILGDEDHLGDMDFKVAGTDSGITALQMDIKITSITPEIMKIAVDQAHKGRLHILGEMAKTIEEPRTDVNEHAPRIVVIQIPKDKIREVIGSGGKVIREICEVSGAKVNIDEDGTINIASNNNESSDKAIQMIKDIVTEPEIGKTYQGTVAKIVDFGAFVNFMGARSGLVHISEIAHERIKNVSDVLKVDEKIDVKVIGIDNRGKIKLSIKATLPPVEEASDGNANMVEEKTPQAS